MLEDVSQIKLASNKVKSHQIEQEDEIARHLARLEGLNRKLQL
jgi:hypothetical protein